MLQISNSEMTDLLCACSGGDNIFDNAPFSKEAKEVLIDKEYSMINTDPYIAGRWLEACIEDKKAREILKNKLENLGVCKYSIGILTDFNGYSKTMSNAVFAFNDLVGLAIKTINYIGTDQDCLTDDEKFEELGGADLFSPDKALCNKIEGLLSKRAMELFDSYFEGERDAQAESSDLAALVLSLDVARNPLEWLEVVDAYESKKYGENVAPCGELRQIIGGFLNASY